MEVCLRISLRREPGAPGSGIHLRMNRPCYLVIDREFSGSISTRKLVIETAKFNVLTAYSADEGIATLRRFPRVDGIVMDAEMQGMSCVEMIRAIRQVAPSVAVIVIHRPLSEGCEGADYQLDTFDPRRLLTLLAELRPKETEAMEKQNEALKQREMDR